MSRIDNEGNSCPESLGEYYDLCKAIGGEDCKACKFLQEKINQSPNGCAEIVIADDYQMRMLLMPMLWEK